MATVYFHQKNNSKALEYYSNSYKIYSIKFGENHPDALVAKDNMRLSYGTNNKMPFEEWLTTISVMTNLC
jgi:hypothetical protein